MVLGRARGICRLPTGVVEISPHCWFTALPEAEHALEFTGSGVYFCATVTWHNAPPSQSISVSTDSSHGPVGSDASSADRTASVDCTVPTKANAGAKEEGAAGEVRQAKISAAALAAAPPGEQKMMLRGPLLEAVQRHCPALATRVTDGLLARDNPELLEMIGCELALRQGIHAFLCRSGGWKKDQATRGGSAANATPDPTTPLRTTAC